MQLFTKLKKTNPFQENSNSEVEMDAIGNKKKQQVRNRFLSGITMLAIIGLPLSLSAQDRSGAQGKQPSRKEGGSGGRGAQSPPKVPDGVKAYTNLEYAHVGEKSLLLDLYIPEKAQGPLPVVVGIHGGAWMSGSKENAPGLSQTSRGYAVACINYRLSSEAIFPAQIEDCKAAVRWIRANAQKYNLDPDHIGATGGSAGGHLVALLGTSGEVKELEGTVGGNLEFSSRIQAVADLFGPTDFLKMDAARVPGSKLTHDEADSPESKLVGGLIQENKEKVAKANPITYISKDDPPFLIVHGDNDPLVPPNQSQLLYDVLIKEGIEAKLHFIKGEGHGGPGFAAPEVRDMIDSFFDKHLKKQALGASN